MEDILEELATEYLQGTKQTEFVKAFERISLRYRMESGRFLQTEEERKAYLFTRLPATFAVACKVLEEVKNRVPNIELDSLLDVGAGPGTGMWATSRIFPDLARVTLLEKDPLFMELGKELAHRSSSSVIQQAAWQRCDMEKAFSAPLSDLVVLSYSIGETDESSWPDLCKRLWGTTNKALVIIEPGTPKGYGRLMKLRSMMLSLGAYLWAPCPHSLPCPLERGDWCHFPARVARSSLHRKLKSADLGYEDEKFSYLVFGKRPIISYKARVIRKPLLHSGWLECITCQESGVKKEVFSKKEGEEYKKKKKLEWGDNF